MAGEEALLKKLANEVAQSFGKELGKRMAAKGISDSMKDSEKSSYKDDSDRPSILEYKGTILAVKELQKNVYGLEKAFQPFTKRIYDATKSLKDFLPHERARKSFQSIMEGAQEYADSQQGVYRELAQQTINYIKDKGTSLEKIDDTAVALNKFREELHNLYAATKDSGKISKEQADGLKVLMENIRDVEGKHIRITEELSEREQEVWEDILHNRKTHGKDIEKTLLERKRVVEKVSKISEEMGESISVAGIYASKGLKEAADNFRQVSKNILRGSLIAAGVGTTQIIEDSIRSYQFILGREYKALSVLMGMSQREVQQGFSDFRDVIRMESAILGEGVFSSAVEDQIHHIQKLGKHHLLMGEEAFRYGMLMKDAARRLGISNDMNEKEMNRFYGETAARLGMHISEFGEFFNSMAQDPSFVGFVNNIRVLGKNVQESMQNEFEQRVKMNKAMGLTVEHLKEQIRLEQSRKYAPIAEKMQAKVRAKMAMNMIERELGIAFNKDERQAVALNQLNPALMTDEQKIIFDRVKNVLTASRALIIKQTKDIAGDRELTSSEINKANMKLELLSTFLKGTTVDNADMGDQILAGMENLAATGGISVDSVIAQIKSGEITDEKLKDAIESITGKSELEDIKNVAEGTEKTILNIYNLLKEKLSGIGQSGIAKVIGGALGATAQIGIGWYQLRALRSIVGLTTDIAVKTGAKAATTTAIRGFATGLAKGGAVGIVGEGLRVLFESAAEKYLPEESLQIMKQLERGNPFLMASTIMNDNIEESIKKIFKIDSPDKEQNDFIDQSKTFSRNLNRLNNFTEERIADMSVQDRERRIRELNQWEALIEDFRTNEEATEELESVTGMSVEELLLRIDKTLEKISEDANKTARHAKQQVEESKCENENRAEAMKMASMERGNNWKALSATEGAEVMANSSLYYS